MLSHAAWQREFGGDPGVLGRMVRTDQSQYEVVGVLPRGFVGPDGRRRRLVPAGPRVLR